MPTDPEYANTPTREPFEVPLTQDQRASIDVRNAAAGAANCGVPRSLAHAEVDFAYDLIYRRAMVINER